MLSAGEYIVYRIHSIKYNNYSSLCGLLSPCFSPLHCHI
nr:MAG TPA: hypothetical protein [Caudoviricetes sp.]